MSKSSLFGLVHKQHRWIACNKIMIFFGKKKPFGQSVSLFCQNMDMDSRNRKKLTQNRQTDTLGSNNQSWNNGTRVQNGDDWCKGSSVGF